MRRMPSSEAMIGMPARLRQNALAGIDQHDREIGGGGAGRHVAGVLLMARRVGDDELALRRREKAVGDVDGDALLALGLQPVHQQREVDILAGRAVLFRIALKRGELVLEDQLGVVEQAADQGRLAVVDRATGQEAQQRFLAPAPQDRRVLRRPAAVIVLAFTCNIIRNSLRASSFPSSRLRPCRSGGPGARRSAPSASRRRCPPALRRRTRSRR